MAAPRKIVVPIEPVVLPPKALPIQSRVDVRLYPRDGQTEKALGPVGDDRRGPWPMSPRPFVAGQYVTAGQDYFVIMSVVHDLTDPATITLLVSIAKDGLPS